MNTVRQFHHLALCCVAALGAPLVPLGAASFQPVGGAFEEDIVCVFIPPTRSDNPLVATASRVHLWDDDAGAWRSLYSPPWASARILAVAGYEKSSKALYVAHSGGVASSGDGGESWAESVPLGYAPQGTVRLLVNPAERRHAVVESGGSAWETTDFGATWTPLPITGSASGLVFLEAMNGEPMLLAAVADRIVRLAGQPLRPAGHIPVQDPIVALVPHPQRNPIFVQLGGGRFAALDFGAGGNVRISELPGRITGSLPVACAAGSSSVFSAAGDRLLLNPLADPAGARFEIGGLPAQPALLAWHPRRQDALYFADSRQLYLLEDAFEGASPNYIQPLANAGLEWREAAWRDNPSARVTASAAEPSAQAPAAAAGAPMDAAVELARVLAGEPGLDEAVRRALELERSQPGVFAEWMHKVRTRHLLPELRIQGGIRQYSVDDYLLVTTTDPFGFEELEDYRLPDRIRDMAYFGIVLEWPLEKLVFDSEIVEISRERRQFFNDRRELITSMGELYYARISRIMEAQGLLGSPTQAQKLRLLLEIHQISEVLNGFCGERLFDPMPVK